MLPLLQPLWHTSLLLALTAINVGANTVPTSCSDDLGLSSGLLSSQNIEASSSFRGTKSGAAYTYNSGDARLFRNLGFGGWAPQTKSTSEYWQADFFSPVSISSVATQGFESRFEKVQRYVTSFQIQVGNVSGVMVPVTWPNGTTRIFSANTDSTTAVSHSFKPPLSAAIVRFTNFTTTGSINPGLRVGIRGCNTPAASSFLRLCDQPLGVSNGLIPDTQVTASTVRSTNYRSYYGRLNRTLGSGGWCGDDPVKPTDYFQVDLGREYYVSAVATQGIVESIFSTHYYLLNYMVEIRKEGSNPWQFLSDIYFGITPGPRHLFTGNNDGKTVNKQYFMKPYRARYIRILNYSIQAIHDPCMRMEVYGCISSIPATTTTTTSGRPVSASSTAAQDAVTSKGNNMQSNVSDSLPSTARASTSTARAGSDSSPAPSGPNEPLPDAQHNSRSAYSTDSTGSSSSETTVGGGGGGGGGTSNSAAIGAGVGAGVLVMVMLALVLVMILLKRKRAEAKKMTKRKMAFSKEDSKTKLMKSNGGISKRSSDSVLYAGPHEPHIQHYEQLGPANVTGDGRNAQSVLYKSSDLTMSGRCAQSALYHSPTEAGPGPTKQTQRSSEGILYQSSDQEQPVYASMTEDVKSASAATVASEGYAMLDPRVKPVLAPPTQRPSSVPPGVRDHNQRLSPYAIAGSLPEEPPQYSQPTGSGAEAPNRPNPGPFSSQQYEVVGQAQQERDGSTGLSPGHDPAMTGQHRSRPGEVPSQDSGAYSNPHYEATDPTQQPDGETPTCTVAGQACQPGPYSNLLYEVTDPTQQQDGDTPTCTVTGQDSQPGPYSNPQHEVTDPTQQQDGDTPTSTVTGQASQHGPHSSPQDEVTDPAQPPSGPDAIIQGSNNTAGDVHSPPSKYEPPLASGPYANPPV